ncbi:RNA polymerase sigma factor [Pseudonocardia acaciae]|uniref:RNA polymerase sigma factor n=1 Tax=Pseudonocardia acaciae TaxID=551276 RepID=UPI0006849B23|nr:sigma-70 family RNA polymerase sigma factor [Pseudonocardia acaciae]
MTTLDTQPQPTTTELLCAAGEGAAQAWEQLVRRFEPMVAAVIRNYRLQDADSRDAAQRTWLLMIEHHRQIREPEALGGWLTTTASRECLRIMRDRRRVDPIDASVQAERPDAGCDTEQQVVDADTAHRLRQLMHRLPKRSHLLLSALFEENPPAYAELSRRTGIPVGSIGPTRARALRQLRMLIETLPAGQPSARTRVGCGV